METGLVGHYERSYLGIRDTLRITKNGDLISELSVVDTNGNQVAARSDSTRGALSYRLCSRFRGKLKEELTSVGGAMLSSLDLDFAHVVQELKKIQETGAYRTCASDRIMAAPKRSKDCYRVYIKLLDLIDEINAIRSDLLSRRTEAYHSWRNVLIFEWQKESADRYFSELHDIYVRLNGDLNFLSDSYKDETEACRGELKGSDNAMICAFKNVLDQFSNRLPVAFEAQQETLRDEIVALLKKVDQERD